MADAAVHRLRERLHRGRHELLAANADEPGHNDGACCCTACQKGHTEVVTALPLRTPTRTRSGYGRRRCRRLREGHIEIVTAARRGRRREPGRQRGSTPLSSPAGRATPRSAAAGADVTRPTPWPAAVHACTRPPRHRPAPLLRRQPQLLPRSGRTAEHRHPPRPPDRRLPRRSRLSTPLHHLEVLTPERALARCAPAPTRPPPRPAGRRRSARAGTGGGGARGGGHGGVRRSPGSRRRRAVRILSTKVYLLNPLSRSSRATPAAVAAAAGAATHRRRRRRRPPPPVLLRAAAAGAPLDERRRRRRRPRLRYHAIAVAARLLARRQQQRVALLLGAEPALDLRPAEHLRPARTLRRRRRRRREGDGVTMTKRDVRQVDVVSAALAEEPSVFEREAAASTDRWAERIHARSSSAHAAGLACAVYSWRLRRTQTPASCR